MREHPLYRVPIQWIQRVRTRSRGERADLFRSLFACTPSTKLLDLGSGDGRNINSVLGDAPITPQNVYIADIEQDALAAGQAKYGYTPVAIPESGRLPFPDGFFDIIYCSSVIEHVTVPKSEIWALTEGDEFERRARTRQQQFASEIARVGKSYFVQTPYKWFVVESHSLLPFLAYVPRPVQLGIMKIANRVWIKSTIPDFRLLDRSQLLALFPGAVLRVDTFAGMTKSIMAIRVQG